MKKKQFVYIGRNCSINASLIKEHSAECVNDRYFIEDVYNDRIELDKKHFLKLEKLLGSKILKSKEVK